MIAIALRIKDSKDVKLSVKPSSYSQEERTKVSRHQSMMNTSENLKMRATKSKEKHAVHATIASLILGKDINASIAAQNAPMQ